MTVHAEAMPLEPAKYPKGIEYVIVNGRFAVKFGKTTEELPGKVIKLQKGGLICFLYLNW